MEDAKIRKPQGDELKQAHFFISEITTVTVENFETILCVTVNKENQF